MEFQIGQFVRYYAGSDTHAPPFVGRVGRVTGEIPGGTDGYDDEPLIGVDFLKDGHATAPDDWAPCDRRYVLAANIEPLPPEEAALYVLAHP